tara:strand:- start:23 stop:205 length:183 start_codon:yes stop_codon:yes gene_type:complete
MKIKLKKDWRAYGQLNKAGTILNIKNEETISYLKENGFLYTEKKEKKEKKAKEKIAEENN